MNTLFGLLPNHSGLRYDTDPEWNDKVEIHDAGFTTKLITVFGLNSEPFVPAYFSQKYCTSSDSSSRTPRNASVLHCLLCGSP